MLLAAGALNRPPKQEAKTRFKDWWALVGWPMEYAAGLLGIEVNCTELMRAGEAGDQEASATSAALTILHKTWPMGGFSAKDVVKVIEAKEVKGLAPAAVDEAAKKQGEALADALGEVNGRRLERPTAHKIGKLFQKHLVAGPQCSAATRSLPCARPPDTRRTPTASRSRRRAETIPTIPAATQPWRLEPEMSGKTGKFPAPGGPDAYERVQSPGRCPCRRHRGSA
jgi:hypothetical protein